MLVDLTFDEIDQIKTALRDSGLEFTKNKQVYYKLTRFVDDADMY
jgi:hypothetical protein